MQNIRMLFQKGMEEDVIVINPLLLLEEVSLVKIVTNLSKLMEEFEKREKESNKRMMRKTKYIRRNENNSKCRKRIRIKIPQYVCVVVA